MDSQLLYCCQCKVLRDHVCHDLMVVLILLNYRSRHEYMDLLLNDLCKYYSYEKFLMGKFMELFPINEVIDCVVLLYLT